MSPLSKKGRYVACLNCGCRLEMNGVCKICGHEDVPLLPGMVPDVAGLTQEAATALIAGPEAQLTLGGVESENSETVEVGTVIGSAPPPNTLIGIGGAVAIVVSLGPAA